jgi:hypothetical protein
MLISVSGTIRNRSSSSKNSYSTRVPLTRIGYNVVDGYEHDGCITHLSHKRVGSYAISATGAQGSRIEDGPVFVRSGRTVITRFSTSRGLTRTQLHRTAELYQFYLTLSGASVNPLVIFKGARLNGEKRLLASSCPHVSGRAT